MVVKFLGDGATKLVYNVLIGLLSAYGIEACSSLTQRNDYRKNQGFRKLESSTLNDLQEECKKLESETKKLESETKKFKVEIKEKEEELKEKTKELKEERDKRTAFQRMAYMQDYQIRECMQERESEPSKTKNNNLNGDNVEETSSKPTQFDESNKVSTSCPAKSTSSSKQTNKVEREGTAYSNTSDVGFFPSLEKILTEALKDQYQFEINRSTEENTIKVRLSADVDTIFEEDNANIRPRLWKIIKALQAKLNDNPKLLTKCTMRPNWKDYTLVIYAEERSTANYIVSLLEESVGVKAWQGSKNPNQPSKCFIQ